MRKVSDMYFFCFCFFFCLLYGIFFSQINGALQRRGAVSQSAFFSISYMLGLPNTLLIGLFLSIIHFTVLVVVLRCHIISISIFRFFYLHILLYSLTDMFLSFYAELSIRRHTFILLKNKTDRTVILQLFYFFIILCITPPHQNVAS